MGKRGPKPHKKKDIEWSANIAYGIGLMATDGCLSPNGRHIDLTSKDTEQLNNFKKCFELTVPISYKISGYTGKRTPRIQFSDVALYRFFQFVGLTPAKTKTIGALAVPNNYFLDFLRGHHDGDGCFYSYWDPRWRSSFMFYLNFVSASKAHMKWLQENTEVILGVRGRVTKSRGVFQLRYAKAESLKVLRGMYHATDVVCLKRKRLKVEKALGIVGERL